VKWRDSWHFSAQALLRHKARTALLSFAVAIGVCSVLLLTSVGEGARHYVSKEFSSLGSDMLIVLPGKKETSGGSIPFYSTTPRDLTIEDAQAIKHLSSVKAVAPVIAGSGLVSYQTKSREVITIGTTQDFLAVRNLTLSHGRGFNRKSADLAEPICILGAQLKQSLFGSNEAMGQWLKIADRRYRVVGILQERGESLGLDMRDMVIIPIRSAESLFNSASLFRILVALKPLQNESLTKQRILSLIKNRHDDEEDITIISQNAMMSSFDKISNFITVAIGIIASISLVVAGFLIMNVSYISVSKRQQEIGLLKAIGATAYEVRLIFLTESALLICLGIFLGLTSGYVLVTLFNQLIPSFTLIIPLWAPLASAIMSLVIGLLFTWLPAAKAANQDPVSAMRGN
jgi:putative ABC transport system permease protein